MYGQFRLVRLSLVGKVPIQLVYYLPAETRVVILQFTLAMDLVKLLQLELQLRLVTLLYLHLLVVEIKHSKFVPALQFHV